MCLKTKKEDYKMIRVGIYDDSVKQVELLRQITTEFFERERIPYEINEIASGVELLENPKHYDVVFLDVVLRNGEDGVDIGMKLRMQNAVVKIVYVTLYEKYRIPATDTYALNFVRKPAKKEEIFKILRMAVSLMRIEPDKIVLEYGKEEHIIDISNILYFKSENHGISICTNTEREDVRYNYTLQDIENKLGAAGKYFAMIHRSYLVNMKQIRKKKKTYVLMKNAEELPISRRKEIEFGEKFENHVTSAKQLGDANA